MGQKQTKKHKSSEPQVLSYKEALKAAIEDDPSLLTPPKLTILEKKAIETIDNLERDIESCTELQRHGLQNLPLQLFKFTKLTELDISYNQLDDIPTEIENLTLLQILNVRSNLLSRWIERPFAPTLHKLSNLRCLDLSRNGINIIPSTLAELSLLEEVDLSHNPLTYPLPQELSSLHNLRILKVRCCGMQHLYGTLIEGLSALEHLDIQYNRIVDVPPEIGCLKNLTYLNFSDNMTNTIPPEIEDLSKLQTLCWERTTSEELPEGISRLTRLTHLQLSNNSKISDILTPICEIQGLTRLECSGCGISRIPRGMSRLSSLQSLVLRWNEIKLSDKEVKRLPLTLSMLDLAGNKLTHITDYLVSHLPNIWYLNVSFNSTLTHVSSKVIELLALTHFTVAHAGEDLHLDSSMKDFIKECKGRSAVQQIVRQGMEDGSCNEWPAWMRRFLPSNHKDSEKRDKEINEKGKKKKKKKKERSKKEKKKGSNEEGGKDKGKEKKKKKGSSEEEKKDKGKEKKIDKRKDKNCNERKDKKSDKNKYKKDDKGKDKKIEYDCDKKSKEYGSRYEEIVDRIAGMMFGAALGDAFGLASEFLNKKQASFAYGIESIRARDIIVDKHRSRWEKGDWTDDTDQMLLILENVVMGSEVVCIKEYACSLLRWARKGYQECGDFAGMGIGQTVNSVLHHKKFLSDPWEASKEIWLIREKNAAANGAVMRTAVLGALHIGNVQQVVKDTIAYARVTHWDPRCVASCIMVTVAISLMLQGSRDPSNPDHLHSIIQDALKEACKQDWEDSHHKKEFRDHVLAPTLSHILLDEDEKIGYTLKCVGSGFVCLKESNFESAILDLMREGGDADTNGAVAGALLGCKVGFSGLPVLWLQDLVHGEWYADKVEELIILALHLLDEEEEIDYSSHDEK